MGANSKIEWCDHTFNPVVGCTKVSAACDFCYAESWARRTGHPELWDGERRRTSDANWRQPLKWNEAAKRDGIRYRVFCASLADVFDNQWKTSWRDELWGLIRACDSLDWLLLTKRPQNIVNRLPHAELLKGHPWPWPNVWLGCTAENQAEADRRIPHLLNAPARVHFLSCEPLLGPIDLSEVCNGYYFQNPLTGHRYHDADDAVSDNAGVRIDWVICGGESGPHARPMHPDWARSLRDQCAAAGVAFHFKQWGEWLIGENDLHDTTFFQDGTHFVVVSDGHDIVKAAAEEAKSPEKAQWRPVTTVAGQSSRTGRARNAVV